MHTCLLGSPVALLYLPLVCQALQWQMQMDGAFEHFTPCTQNSISPLFFQSVQVLSNGGTTHASDLFERIILRTGFTKQQARPSSKRLNFYLVVVFSFFLFDVSL